MRASPLDGSGGGRRASGKSRTISAAGLRAVRGAGLGWLPWLANLGGGRKGICCTISFELLDFLRQSLSG